MSATSVTGPAALSPAKLAALLLTAVGFAGLVVAFTAAPWADFTNVGGPQLGFGDIGAMTDAPGIVGVYFGWLGWLLAVAALLLALLAELPRLPRPDVAAGAAVTTALAGLGFGLWAVSRLISAWDNTGLAYGMWLTFGGFTLIGVGAALARAVGGK